MTALIRRPLLVGGVGLSVLLWLWTNLEASADAWGEWITLVAIACGSLWWWQQKFRTPSQPTPPQPLNRAQVEQTFARVEQAINTLAQEQQDISEWQNRLNQLRAETNRQTLKILVTGGKQVGKTSILSLFADPENWTETPALFTPNPTEAMQKEIQQQLLHNDVVLLVVTGDLTDSEYQILQKLHQSHPVIVVVNKQDHYPPEEQPEILAQVRHHVAGIVGNANILPISAAPQPIKVRQYQPDGTLREWMETPPPQIEPLKTRLAQLMVTATVPILGTIQRQAEALEREVQGVWNQIRRNQALPAIEQYQWIAAAAAFANPIPSLDLLTTGAITGQLMLDLAAIYQPTQTLTLQHTQKAAGTLGELIVKLGLVELSTQTITGILKTNAITYTAGGIVQGISAAYLTHIAGLSLIEYFQNQEFNPEQGLNLDKLTAILKSVFQQNQRTALIQSFVSTAISKLRSPEQAAIAL